MPNALDPAFITVEYVTAHGPHEQTLPINNINIDEADPINTTVECWDLSDRPWVDMVTDLVTLFLPRFPNSTNFGVATLWSQPEPDDLPRYLAATLLDLDGSNLTPGYNLATQETITARDTSGYIAKIELLDMASTNNFDKQTTLAAAGIEDLFAEWSAVTNGWASRAGNRVATFIKATRTLNEELRRRYHQT